MLHASSKMGYNNLNISVTFCKNIPYFTRYQTFFYGVDLSNLRQQAYDEYFKQPIVDAFDPQVNML